MKIKCGFVLEEVGGSYLAVAVGSAADSFSGMVKMNGTGAFLWKLLEDGEKSEDDLVSSLCDEYEVDEITARDGVRSFVKKLLDGGILE